MQFLGMFNEKNTIYLIIRTIIFWLLILKSYEVIKRNACITSIYMENKIFPHIYVYIRKKTISNNGSDTGARNSMEISYK